MTRSFTLTRDNIFNSYHSYIDWDFYSIVIPKILYENGDNITKQYVWGINNYCPVFERLGINDIDFNTIIDGSTDQTSLSYKVENLLPTNGSGILFFETNKSWHIIARGKYYNELGEIQNQGSITALIDPILVSQYGNFVSGIPDNLTVSGTLTGFNLRSNIDPDDPCIYYYIYNIFYSIGLRPEIPTGMYNRKITLRNILSDKIEKTFTNWEYYAIKMPIEYDILIKPNFLQSYDTGVYEYKGTAGSFGMIDIVGAYINGILYHGTNGTNGFSVIGADTVDGFSGSTGTYGYLGNTGTFDLSLEGGQFNITDYNGTSGTTGEFYVSKKIRLNKISKYNVNDSIFLDTDIDFNDTYSTLNDFLPVVTYTEPVLLRNNEFIYLIFAGRTLNYNVGSIRQWFIDNSLLELIFKGRDIDGITNWQDIQLSLIGFNNAEPVEDIDCPNYQEVFLTNRGHYELSPSLNIFK